ncbi:hypothetical protein [Desulfosporosinus metallidurans]|uniref:Uncharacterized protein n=1 Tax=Desulfosporosinus metallidurans TaxID=1888891 RepID=A0A1Q8QEJ4_9FIRM|nr:hypothetical protein [Desulfosporosinus metallidurans]OLN25783.1 hypothetical protein DSOL_5227 [Desulfosporosinus metallidurans]
MAKQRLTGVTWQDSIEEARAFYVIAYHIESNHAMNTLVVNHESKNRIVKQYESTGTMYMPFQSKNVKVRKLIVSRIEEMLTTAM